ncbi:MAG TPA: HGxxPAAW family protein [Nocardioides sp.]|nr:HGxxPAAW family protein [Nocardioides sp.]
MAENHGNTPAAWTGVLVSLVGFLIGAVGMATDPLNWTLFWIGVAVVVIGAVVFGVLAKLGFHESAH